MSAPQFAEIEIDYEKCKVPFDCKKCLQSCTQAVFGVTSVNVQKGQEVNPK